MSTAGIRGEEMKERGGERDKKIEERKKHKWRVSVQMDNTRKSKDKKRRAVRVCIVNS